MPSDSYRPSKQFLKRGAIAISIVLVILVVQTSWFRALFNKKPLSPVASMTVGDIVTEDTNGNGIPNWEEELWGLDPTTIYTGGVSNKEIIESKRAALGIQSTSEADLDDTDRIARQLFTLTSALGQSDEVDSATLQSIAATLGDSVDIKAVSNIYTLKDVQTSQTTTANLQTYTTTLKKTLSKYDATTPDIEVLAMALENEDASGLPQLAQSATTYQKLAKDLVAMRTPLGLAQDHLALANSFAGIATSLIYMTELNDNSLKALVGVAIYKNYSIKLGLATTNINAYLTQYGILQQ